MSAAIDGLPQDTLAAFAVWIPMLPGDNASAATESSKLLDGRAAAQFYDAEGRAGRAIASSLGAEGQIAWDMYLAYGGDARW